MPNDLYNRNPASAYALAQDEQRRKAGLVICGMAIASELTLEEITEMLMMLGIKEK